MRLRKHGYAPIVVTGRTKQSGAEASVIVPNIKTHHLKSIGNEFNQLAVIYAQKGKGTVYWLDAAGKDKAGSSSEDFGRANINASHKVGMIILAGVGWGPKDEDSEEECVLEAFWLPPIGRLNPSWKPYPIE